MEIQSFYNDQSLKDKYIARVKMHEEADAIVKGQYWQDGKGCAIGCTFEVSEDPHATGAKEWSVPEWLLRLEDTIFEGLPNGQAKAFPLQFVNAVPVGKDEAFFNRVKWKFTSFILKENIDRVLALTLDEELKKQVIDAVRAVLVVIENALTTGIWDDEAARSARSAAWSAAWSAAESAARSARSAARSAESAAWSAARSAESAAWSAVWSAESAARSAESAAWSAAYCRYRDELLKLLQSEN